MRTARMARKVCAVVWAVIPPLLLSALIHTTDRDIDGIRGLTDPSALFSVLFYALPVAIVVVACLGLAIRFRWSAWVSVGVVFSAVVALALTLLRTPRLPGIMGIARPFLGGTALVWGFLAGAVLPARALGWPRGGARHSSEGGERKACDTLR